MALTQPIEIAVEAKGGIVGWRFERAVDGQLYVSKDGKRYRYMDANGDDPDKVNRYLCPKCGNPIRYSAWLRFYCDACNSDWCYETELAPNLEGGMWEEVDPCAR